MRVFLRLGLFIALLTATIAAQSQSLILEGRVSDADSHEPLAFVSIQIKGSRSGVLSDIDGYWKLSAQPGDTLLFSYVGYTRKELRVSTEMQGEKQSIHLHQSNLELKEVVIFSKENPAHRIIQAVLDHKRVNNWERIPEFTYTSYNRFHITSSPKDSVDEDTTAFNNGLVSISFSDSAGESRQFFEKHHLFLTESVVETRFKAPEKLNQTIVASKVSGTKDARFSLLAGQFNTINIYKDYVEIGKKKYLSPIAYGAIKRYYFEIRDTLWSPEKDTIFVIAYQPRNGKLFDGFKGVLYISSNKYAVQNVIAKPGSAEGLASVKMQQQFAYVDGAHWFPVQVNADYIFTTIMGTNDNLVGVGRSYFKNINFTPGLRGRDFSAYTVEIDKNAHLKDSSYWAAERTDSLTQKDKATYEFIDSVGKAQKLDAKIKTMDALLTGKLPVGFIDIDLNRILSYNGYEGWRLGAGISTNDKISRYFSLGGYGAYGFKDKALKYGTHLHITPFKGSFFQLGGAYSYDVSEFGGSAWQLDRKKTILEKVRPFNVTEMFGYERTEGWLRWKMLRYLQLQLGMNHVNEWANNAYTYLDDDGETQNRFRYNEATLSLRYAYKEKTLSSPGHLYSLGTGNHPVLWVEMSKGLMGLTGGQGDYFKLEAKLEKSFKMRYIGTSKVQLRAGKIWGDVPLFETFNGGGGNGRSKLLSENAFQTMRPHEFFSSEYAGLFYTHSFENLFKIGKHRPALNIHQNMAFGRLSNRERHQGMDFSTMEKGYFESGISLDKLLPIMKPIFGLQYFLGGGVFYQYGPYAASDAKDNVSFKVSLSVGI